MGDRENCVTLVGGRDFRILGVVRTGKVFRTRRSHGRRAGLRIQAVESANRKVLHGNCIVKALVLLL
jgi:hypothetical protein